MTCVITPNDLARLKLRPTPIGACDEITSLDPKDPSNAARMSLADYFTDITTSSIKSDISCLINGDKGTGKSYLTLSEGVRCADCLAEKNGGQWNDYFNIDLIAIMDPEEVFDLLQLSAKRCVKAYDDVSTAINSRSFMSKTNRASNDILVTNRTDNNIQFWSTPDQSFTDLVLRKLCNYYIEAELNIPAVRAGFNVVRVFKKTLNRRTGKMYYPTMWFNNRKLVRTLINGSDPRIKKLQEEYDIKREKASEKIKRSLAESQKESEKSDESEYINPKTTQAMARASRTQSSIDQRILIGMSLEEALKDIKMPFATYNRWVESGWVSGRKAGKTHAKSA